MTDWDRVLKTPFPEPPGISEESKRRHMNSDEDTIQYLTEVCCMSKCAALNLIADVIEGKVPGIGWNGKSPE